MKNSASLSLSAVALAVLCLSLNAGAESMGFPQIALGYYPSAKTVTEWGPDKNVIWKTPLAKESFASPCVIGERIFITAEPGTLICVGKAGGKILWEKSHTIEEALSPEQAAQAREDAPKVAQIKAELEPLEREWQQVRDAQTRNPRDPELKKKGEALNQKVTALKKEFDKQYRFGPPMLTSDNGYASATPFSDGQRVWMVYGDGVVECCDVSGARQWIRYIEKPGNTKGWGHSASPVVSDGLLLVHLTDLVALDAATGAERWRAPIECSWGTPLIEKIGGVSVVITPRGDFLRLSDGQILARKIFMMPWGMPFVQDGVLYAIDEPGGKAVRLPAKAAEGMKPEILWKSVPYYDRFYGTGVIHDGALYAATGNGTSTLDAFDAVTGKLLFEKRFHVKGARVFASIVLSGNHLFVTGEGGETIVLEAGREYKEMRRNLLEPYRTTPVIDDGRIYIRGSKNLYCIGKRL